MGGLQNLMLKVIFMQNLMNRKKIFFKILLICISVICVFVIFKIIFLLCLFKEEYFEKYGINAVEISNIFPHNKKIIIPNEISNFSYLYKKSGWNTSIFWKGAINRKSFDNFIKSEGLITVQNPPIYDFLIENELKIKVSKPYEVYEFKNDKTFIYIYDNSEQIFGIYTSK